MRRKHKTLRDMLLQNDISWTFLNFQKTYQYAYIQLDLAFFYRST